LPLELALKNDKKLVWEDSSESEDNDEPNMGTELGQNMAEVTEILSDLFKLSFKIRNPATRSTEQSVLKALAHQEIIQLDDMTVIDLMDSYSHYDRGHVVESFMQLRRSIQGEADTRPSNSVDFTGSSKVVVEGPNHYLIERWSKSVTNRRRYFAYWRNHARKLAAVDFEETKSKQRLSEETKSLPHGLIPNQGQKQINISRQQIRAPPSTTGETILSETEGTKYNSKLDDDIGTQSVVSYVSTAYNVDGAAADLPPPPWTQPEQTEFTCPYCCVVCPLRYKSGRSWRY
jgi:hypothetical protein